MSTELERRRPDFRGEPYAEPVTLRDGQTWWVPKPQVRLYPSEDMLGFERVASFGEPEFDARFNDLQQALDRASESETGLDPQSGKTVLGILFEQYRVMLERNYTLSFAEFRALVWFETGEEEGDPLALSLSAIAQGLSGKGRSSGGDALSQSLAV